MSKTRKEIDELKSSWMRDPIWEIENTEGFEKHKDELRKFSIEKKEFWITQNKTQLQLDCERLGTPNADGLVIELRWIRAEIDLLRRRMDGIEGRMESRLERVSNQIAGIHSREISY